MTQIHPCSRCGQEPVINRHHGEALVVCERCADEMGQEFGIRDFVNWIATNAAYNGAADEGQRFYDECLNAWLPKQVERYLTEKGLGA